MAESKAELIMQAIKTRLEAVSAIASVQRFEMNGNTFVNVPVAIVQFSETTHSRRVQPNIVWEQATILVGVYVRHDKTIDPRSTDAVLVALDGDIYAAVMADRTLGGLTKDLSRVSVFPEDIEEPVKHVGHVSEFMADYTHLIDSVIN